MRQDISRWLRSEFDVITPSSEDFRVDCPFCPRPDTKQHLYVSIHKPVAHCFRCDWSGTYVKLVKEVSGVDSYIEAMRLIEQPRNVAGFKTVVNQLLERRQKQLDIDVKDMPDWYVPFNSGLFGGYHAKSVLKYATKRLGTEQVHQLNIGYCDDVEEELLQFRMIIPIEGNYWQARSTSSSARQKYINPEIPIGNRLFNSLALDICRRIYVAEGVLSAVALGPSAVAVLGNKASEGQIGRIAGSYVDSVTIAFDADTEFSKQVSRLADVLVHSGKEVTIRQYSDGDPDSCDVWTEEPYDMKYKVFAKMNGGW